MGSVHAPTVVKITLTGNGSSLYGTYEATYILLPTTDTTEITLNETITELKVYDNNGSKSYYSEDCDGYLVLTAQDGKKFTVDGIVTAECTSSNACDYCKIYDGKNTSTTPIYDCSTRNCRSGDLVDIETSGNVMTIYFKSDGSSSFEGLDFNVKVID